MKGPMLVYCIVPLNWNALNQTHIGLMLNLSNQLEDVDEIYIKWSNNEYNGKRILVEAKQNFGAIEHGCTILFDGCASETSKL